MANCPRGGRFWAFSACGRNTADIPSSSTPPTIFVMALAAPVEFPFALLFNLRLPPLCSAGCFPGLCDLVFVRAEHPRITGDFRPAGRKEASRSGEFSDCTGQATGLKEGAGLISPPTIFFIFENGLCLMVFYPGNMNFNSSWAPKQNRRHQGFSCRACWALLYRSCALSAPTAELAPVLNNPDALPLSRPAAPQRPRAASPPAASLP